MQPQYIARIVDVYVRNGQHDEAILMRAAGVLTERPEAFEQASLVKIVAAFAATEGFMGTVV